ncbi:hypothetical protein LINGRAHAP2_LOCUS9329, partial [Linum grandiflorum]
RYRLKLRVSDSITEATFLLLGLTTDRILPIYALDLARAYPDDYGELPPTLQSLIGQTGLIIPRAQLATPIPHPPPAHSPR